MNKTGVAGSFFDTCARTEKCTTLHVSLFCYLLHITENDTSVLLEPKEICEDIFGVNERTLLSIAHDLSTWGLIEKKRTYTSGSILFKMMGLKPKQKRMGLNSPKRAVSVERGENIIHRIRLLVEERKEGYRWSAKDAKLTRSIIDTINYKCKVAKKRGATDDEIFHTFTWILDNIHVTKFPGIHWTIGSIHVSFESVWSQLVTHDKGATKQAKAMGNIDQAMEIIRKRRGQ